MSRRLWGACASEQGLMEAAMGSERLSLRLTELSRDPIGWGIGFYESGETLVRKRPLEDRDDLDLLGVVSETRSELLIGHVRAPTVGALRAENTHPFRFRSFLFAHSGTISKFTEIKAKMVESMPAFIRRSLSGETDSECFFYLILSFLHDARQLDSLRLTSGDVAEAMTRALTMIDKLEADAGVEVESAHNILFSNGVFLIALRRGPIELRTMTFVASGRDQIRPRAVLIGCEHSTRGSEWTTLPDRSIFTIERDLKTQVIPL